MRSLPRRPASCVVAAPTAALTAALLAGCGAPAGPVAGDAIQVGRPTPVGTPSPAAPSPAPTGSSLPVPVVPGGVPARPAPGGCVDLPEAADGVYRVADAGTVTVVRDGDRLVLTDVEPATGWTAAVDHDDAREVEVELRRGAEALDLEVEVEDGPVAVEICSDDD